MQIFFVKNGGLGIYLAENSIFLTETSFAFRIWQFYGRYRAILVFLAPELGVSVD